MKQKGIIGTFATRGNVTSQTPIITWNSTEFGAEYSPENRCKIVSKRLTNAVVHNGGKLGSLALSTGLLNNQSVVCFITLDRPECSETNLLFTLNSENAKNTQSVLANMFNFGKARGTNTNAEVYESGAIIYLDLLVNRAFKKDSSTDSLSNPVIFPSPIDHTTKQKNTW